MKKTSFLLFYGVICLIGACKHDTALDTDVYHRYSIPNQMPIPKDVSCQCAISCSEVHPSLDTVKFLYKEVCFRHGHPYQIAYLRGEPSAFRKEIWTFDFETGVSQKMLSNAAYGLSWSNQNWITYTGTDRQIYKIKANGDSLTQLTRRNYYCNYPEWTWDGNQIVFSTDLTGSLHIIDGNGQEKDTLFVPGGFLKHIWIDSSTVVQGDTDGEILAVNIRTKARTIIRNRPVPNPYVDMPFLFGGSSLKREVYWMMNVKGHYTKTNIDTKVSTIVSELKQNNFITTKAYYTAQTDKIIQVRDIFDFFQSDTIPNSSPCWRKRVNYLTIMNSDGTDERKIILPQ
jgi:hypothetical protein